MADRKPGRRRRRWVLPLVALIAVLAVAGGAVALTAAKRADADPVLTATATRGTVAVGVTGSGSLVDQYTYSVAAGTTPALTERAGVATGATGQSTAASSSTTSASGAAASGSTAATTTSVSVALGQRVKKDQKLAEVEDADGKKHAVKTPVAGHVRSLSTAAHASASQVATIGAGDVLASVFVSETEITRVAAGQTVALALGSVGTAFTGTVQGVGQVPDDSTGVQRYQVLVAVPRTPTGARIGMTVTGTITVARVDGVVHVPAAAIEVSRGRTVVRVVGAKKTTRTVPVTIGLVGDAAVQIRSGLQPGQRVVVGTDGTIAATVRRLGQSAGGASSSSATPSATTGTGR